MIKKTIRLLMLCFALFQANLIFAQAGSYTFSTSSAAFTPITGGTDVNSIEVDDALSASLPIGFTFEFEGTAYTNFKVSSNGWLSFGSPTSSTTGNDLDGASSAMRPVIAPLWDDLEGASASSSKASYSLSGTAPNRVLTMEWLNWRWNYSVSDSVVSFQVKLHETSNEIEFTYRWEYYGGISSPSASIGLTGANSFLSVTGIASGTPTVSNTIEDNSIDSIVTDQVFTFTPPACPGVSGMQATNVGLSSIAISWKGNGSGPWYVHWGPCGFNQATPGVQLATVTDTNFTASGLTANTQYEFHIIEDCGTDGLSDTVNMGCINTLCDALALPLMEGFNSSSTTESCWTVRDENSDGDFWDMNYGSNEYEGDGVAALYTDFNSGSNDDWLISPALALSGNDRLIFQYRVQSSGEPNDFELLLSTTGTNPSDFTDTLMPLTSFSNTTYQEMNVNLSAFSDTVYIAWHVPQGGLDGWRLYIDEVVVENTPPCLDPTDFHVSLLGSDSVQLSWSSDTGAVGHGIEYGPTGFTPGTGTLVSITDTFAVIKSLSPQTGYDFYITDTCTAGFSNTIGPLAVTTSCVTQALPYTESFGTDLGCFIVTQDGGSTNDTWEWVTDHNGTNTLDGSPGFVIVDSDGAGSGVSMDEILNSPPIDASSVTGALVLEFDQYYRSSGDMAAVDVWDGTQWVNVLSQTSTIGSWGTPDHQFIDVTAYANAGFQVRFHYNDMGNWAWYWAIDNFSVTELPCGIASGLDTGLVMPTTAELKWTSNGSLWNIEWGPQGFGQGSQSAGGYMIKGVSSNPYTLTNLGPDSCYDFYVQDTCAGIGAGMWVGPFSFCTPPTCPAPRNLGVVSTGLTLNSADVYWTPGLATNFNIEYGVAGFTQGTGGRMQSTNDTATISGLSPGTEYEFYVRDSCSATDTSTWAGPFSFVTPFNTNYLEDFAISSPFGWTEADGRLTSNTVFTSTTSSSWTIDDFANTGTNKAQKVNIWLGSQYEWLISPSIYLDPTITNLQVEFDVAITDYSSNTQGYFGSDDSLVVVISTDNGATWSSTDVLWYADATDTVDFNGEHVIVPLSGYSGYVKFGFYAGSAFDDPEDNDWFVDNFEVRTPRACPFPTGLTVSDIGTDSALVSWTEGSAGFINAEVIYTVGNQPASAGTIVNSTNDSVVITGLTNATAYCVYIVEECANGFSDTIGPVCFSTLCLPQNLPYIEDFNVSLGCFTAIDGGTTPDTWFHTASYNSSTLDGTPFAFVDSDDAGSGNHVSEKLESVQLDASGISNPLVLTFDHYYNNISTDSAIVEVFDGVQWVMVANYTSDQGMWGAPARDSLDITPYANAALQVRFRYEDNNVWAWYWAVDNVRIYEVSCPAPSNVVANALGCDSVEVTWNSGINTTSTTIVYGTKGFTPPAGTVVTNATSPYIITGLTMNTEYEIYVVDSCSGDVSFPVGPVAVKTDSVGPVMASFTSIQSDTTANDATVDFDASASTGDGLTYDWDFGNGSTGTGVNASGTYTSNGTVSVKLTVTDRCGNTDDTTITVVVSHISISENLYNVGIDVYPNPSNGNFKVNISGNNVAYAIEVTDLSGKVVYKNANLKGGEEQEVNLGNVASGVYLIRISGDGLNATQRMMID